MKKRFYKFVNPPLCGVAFILLLTNVVHAQATSRHVFVPANSQQTMWLPVNKGDGFDIRTTITPARRRHFLSGILGALGIAAITYQTQSGDAQSKWLGIRKRPYLLPGIGLGVGAAALELVGSKKQRKAGLHYTFYNKDSVPVAFGMATKAKGGELVLKGTAPSDGFLQVSTVNKNGGQQTDVAVGITPATVGDTGIYATKPPGIRPGGGAHTNTEHELPPVTVYGINYWFYYDGPPGGSPEGGTGGDGVMVVFMAATG